MRRKIIPYNPKLKEIAQKLRKQGILSEVLLWNELKRKKMMGYDFHRQKPLDNYIADFFCNELMLIIEIDGITHESKTEEDEKRQKRLEELGFSFLRFYDGHVKNYMVDVLETIREWIIEHTPNPSQEGNFSFSNSINFTNSMNYFIISYNLLFL
jgi:very-short-patch-repair endonuclease